MEIQELNYRDDLVLVTNSQDVRALRKDFTHRELVEASGLDGFFVKIENGDYTEIYGFSGVPYLYKPVYRIR